MTSAAGVPRTSAGSVAVRLTWGFLLLGAPGLVLRLMAVGRTRDADGGCRPRRVLRVLGVRHLAQAAFEWQRGASTRNIGTGIDVLHLSTDIGFACLDARWRRAAVTDALVTAGLVALGLTNI